MSDQGDSTGLPLRRERREAERPIRLAAEHVYLIAAAFTLAAIAVLIVVDTYAQVWVARGVYALLAAVICVSGTGLIVRLEAARNRRIVCAEAANLRKLQIASDEDKKQAYAVGYIDGMRGDPPSTNVTRFPYQSPTALPGRSEDRR